MYIELTPSFNPKYNQATKRLVPLGTFDVVELNDGGAMIVPTSCHCDSDFEQSNWKCVETYQEVRAMIAKSNTTVYVLAR